MIVLYIKYDIPGFCCQLPNCKNSKGPFLISIGFLGDNFVSVMMGGKCVEPSTSNTNLLVAMLGTLYARRLPGLVAAH